jgi:hypothetical protein
MAIRESGTARLRAVSLGFRLRQSRAIAGSIRANASIARATTETSQSSDNGDEDCSLSTIASIVAGPARR